MSTTLGASPQSSPAGSTRKVPPGMASRADTDAEDDIVRYGSIIRLYATSQYADGKGGYVGYYKKSRPPRGVWQYVAIPPFDGARQHLFSPSCFTVEDPRGRRQAGDEVCYGDEVCLVDDHDQVWNNAQGPISYIGPKPRRSNGQMHLKLCRELNGSGLDAHLELLDAAAHDDAAAEGGPAGSPRSPGGWQSGGQQPGGGGGGGAGGVGSPSSTATLT